jgi:glycine hydroxymethyltransferase
MEAHLRPWLADYEAARVDELLASFQNIAPEQVYEQVALLMQRSEALFDYQSLNLYAGTNIMDPRAQRALHSSLGSRPSLGYPGGKYEMGLQDAEAIETLCLSLARRLFDCAYVEFRVHSGSLANLYSYMALAQPGDIIFIARAIADCLQQRKSTEAILQDVRAFRSRFQTLHFVLE